ncbi:MULTISPECIES: glycine cleavage system protein R [Pseudovibrio]|uniref:glycine cleavage system protein R n=1 Tax=Stappiaceae TaxID=2821832 RepID=UPI002365CD02|nr:MULTISPECIES: ACT domain-containing protein [Pseudovibrio]MDD7909886.1 ACT domain-containing protein [Pseudovibrio exalbescens]MDX5592223.1 ACT domain-containing protein [Pseudovibrio sp. SPO723]
MTKELILTIIADDRPGLVGLLSGKIANHGASWIDSSLSRLGGHFAGILRVAVAGDKEKALIDDIASLADQGLTITFHDATAGTKPDGTHAVVSLIGQEQPGMVSRVSAVFAELGVNIETLESIVEPGSMSGELMFKATAEVILPPHVDAGQLSSALENIAGDLMIEISLEPTA